MVSRRTPFEISSRLRHIKEGMLYWHFNSSKRQGSKCLCGQSFFHSDWSWCGVHCHPTKHDRSYRFSTLQSHRSFGTNFRFEMESIQWQSNCVCIGWLHCKYLPLPTPYLNHTFISLYLTPIDKIMGHSYRWFNECLIWIQDRVTRSSS